MSRSFPRPNLVFFRSSRRLTFLLNVVKGGDNQPPTYMSLPYIQTKQHDILFRTQDLRTPWYQDMKTWVGVASAAFLAVFSVFFAKEDGDSHIWGVFLGFSMLLLGAEFVLIIREYKLLCFTPRVEAARDRNEHGSEAHV